MGLRFLQVVHRKEHRFRISVLTGQGHNFSAKSSPSLGASGIDFRLGRHDYQVIPWASRPILAQSSQINTQEHRDPLHSGPSVSHVHCVATPQQNSFLLTVIPVANLAFTKREKTRLQVNRIYFEPNNPASCLKDDFTQRAVMVAYNARRIEQRCVSFLL